MILDKLPILNKMRLILASGSPRRKEILQKIGLKFEIMTSDFPENLDKKKYTAKQYVIENAKMKAIDVYNKNKTQKNNLNFDLIIGCDTVVILNNQILEKPTSKKHAIEMLKQLSNNHSTVISGNLNK